MKNGALAEPKAQKIIFLQEALYHDFYQALKSEYAGLAEEISMAKAGISSDMARKFERLERLIKEERSVVYTEREKIAEDLTVSLEQLNEENKHLKEKNLQLESLLRSYKPHVRLFRTATIVFVLCAASFLGWLWFSIELVHPVFALLGMVVCIGFMFMARVAGRSKESRKGSKATSQIDAVLGSLQPMQIMITNQAAVRDYLLCYSDMIDLLPILLRVTRERFEIPTQLSLEVYRDPETDDEYLTLYIRQENYDANIMEIIEDIRAEYYKHLTGKSGWLHLTTDFRPPR